jgi:hypothetical protein
MFWLAILKISIEIKSTPPLNPNRSKTIKGFSHPRSTSTGLDGSGLLKINKTKKDKEKF